MYGLGEAFGLHSKKAFKAPDVRSYAIRQCERSVKAGSTMLSSHLYLPPGLADKERALGSCCVYRVAWGLPWESQLPNFEPYELMTAMWSTLSGCQTSLFFVQNVHTDSKFGPTGYLQLHMLDKPKTEEIAG